MTFLEKPSVGFAGSSIVSGAVPILLLALASVSGGCAGTPEQANGRTPAGPYYPPPPETPRFAFERTIQSSLDLEEPQSSGGLRRALTGESVPLKALAKPFDVVACQGTVYVSDTVSRAVLAFEAGARRVLEIGNTEPGLLRKPLGLATDGDCNLFVADGTSRTIQIYDREGTFRSAVGGAAWFERLSHVAVDERGERIYAVDTGGVDSDAHRIRVFDAATGEHIRDIGTRGVEPGQFNLPRDITLDREGLIYVVDGGNFRVQVFDPEGHFLREIGSLGRMYGQFARPKGVAVDADGNVYVSDSAHGNFQIFDTDGALLLFVGFRSESPGPAAYMLPAGIDVDEDGRIYMIDQYFRKVDVYRPVALGDHAGYLGVWPD